MSQAVAHTQKPSQSPPSYGAGSRAKARFTLRDVTSSLYLAPAAIVFLVFVVYPLIRTFVLSMSGTDILGRQSKFVGLRNFQRVFSDPE